MYIYIYIYIFIYYTFILTFIYAMHALPENSFYLLLKIKIGHSTEQTSHKRRGDQVEWL